MRGDQGAKPGHARESWNFVRKFRPARASVPFSDKTSLDSIVETFTFRNRRMLGYLVDSIADFNSIQILIVLARNEIRRSTSRSVPSRFRPKRNRVGSCEHETRKKRRGIGNENKVLARRCFSRGNRARRGNSQTIITSGEIQTAYI